MEVEEEERTTDHIKEQHKKDCTTSMRAKRRWGNCIVCRSVQSVGGGLIFTTALPMPPFLSFLFENGNVEVTIRIERIKEEGK